eukprot:TRINITY_DN3768_c0_g1_i2.p1 TRINITY_DN3768_c0_g1~~TRINITY_DN3768_c0_g1_i2.p1  ORF type:complete len:279 (-),score=29.84 TRINITY_DN3768_c0_g1_i2:475-1311(-)
MALTSVSPVTVSKYGSCFFPDIPSSGGMESSSERAQVRQACSRQSTAFKLKSTFKASPLDAPHLLVRQRAVQKKSATPLVSAAMLPSTETASDSKLGPLFQDVEILNTTGEVTRVTDLWSERRVVIGWARHFGCLLCRKRAATMVSLKAELDQGGVTLVIIGPGSPEQARTFKEQTSFEGEVYADPQMESFKKLGFVYGPGSIFTPQALVNLVGASLEGFRQDWGLSLQRETVMKGGWQQGGVMVAGPGNDALLFLHKDNEAGDEPDWSVVVKAALSE